MVSHGASVPMGHEEDAFARPLWMSGCDDVCPLDFVPEVILVLKGL